MVEVFQDGTPYKRKAFTEVSVDTRLIADRLSRAEVDEIVTYAELSRLINRDVTVAGRSTLTTARRRVERECGNVFDPVYKIGLKRLSDKGIVQNSQRSTDRIRRQARRAATRLGIVDYPQLGEEEQVAHNVAMSLLSAVQFMAQRRQVNRLTKEVQRAQTQLPSATVLKLFSNDGE